MLNLNIPLPYLVSAAYLTAGGLVLWCCWDKVPSITNLQSGRYLIAFTTTAVLLGFFVTNRGTFPGRSNIATGMEPRSPDDWSCPTDDQNRYSTRDRTRFDSDFPKVLGYPSGGGVLMLPLDIAVAEYLSIPRLETARRASDQTEEDAFCRRLRLLGAKWWESEDTYIRKLIGFDEMTEMEGKDGITVGWPGKEGEGGVWILRKLPGTEMMRMCLNMRERCELLERLGATFYEDAREVEEFREVLSEQSAQRVE
ncbi:hypothetical protein CB0940_04009 [Cercospora beticola]|uniref:Uncharacterized protein n=1 Tax=Cercospora beticola TaxID=122368 RepID=A0A2G5HP35_CERBT|nr:hypothetical protein CB0940_04009 [Cercospora beticola]PIA93962.1 hypothetical protein CB0940_04009 [Cercospora beticola]WPB01218.1 hypothetical protein RHO25_005841 [Cercospora beticola]CAK1364024.1 unnamed protein product [Cercospora beticola]